MIKKLMCLLAIIMLSGCTVIHIENGNNNTISVPRATILFPMGSDVSTPNNKPEASPKTN